MSKLAILYPNVIDGKQFEYINIIDSVTGQPVNGDTLMVTYSQSINGVATTYTVNVPGQTRQIYEGTYNPTAEWGIISQSTGSVNPPPVNQCDLTISSVNIDKPESSIGAHDAQATVSAQRLNQSSDQIAENTITQILNILTL